MRGFMVCVSALYDVRTTTKSRNDTFLRMYPVVKRRTTVVTVLREMCRLVLYESKRFNYI